VTFIAALASSASNSTSSISDVEPGLLGFLVVAALAVALVFLLRSMNKQFKKIGPRPEDEDRSDPAADESQSTATADAGPASTSGAAKRG
jgi:hypothetical protein